MNMSQQIPADLQELRDELSRAGAILSSAKTFYEQCRQRLVAHPLWQQSVTVKPFGSRDFAGLRAEVREYRKWDNGQLAELKQKVPASLWPFKTEFKEDKRAAKMLAERHPELWAELKEALTITAGTPAFTVPKED